MDCYSIRVNIKNAGGENMCRNLLLFQKYVMTCKGVEYFCKPLYLRMDALFLYSGLAKAEDSDDSEAEVTKKKKKGKGKKGKKVK